MDAYYERGLKRWDEAAGLLLVREAGGVTADLDGEPHGRDGGGDAGAPARSSGRSVALAAAGLQQVVDQRLDLLVREAALEGGHRVAEALDEEGLRAR